MSPALMVTVTKTEQDTPADVDDPAGDATTPTQAEALWYAIEGLREQAAAHGATLIGRQREIGSALVGVGLAAMGLGWRLVRATL